MAYFRDFGVALRGQPRKKFLNISGLCIFHAESNGSIYFALSIKTKEVWPIFHNPGSRDIARSVPAGGKNQFLSQNCVDLYTC